MADFRGNFIMSKAVREAYKRGEEDEKLEPIVLFDDKENPIGRIKDRDYVIFYDIRGEREIELTKAFVEKNFDKFHVKKMNLNFVTMIEYDKNLDVKVAFPPSKKIKNTLSEVISKNGLKQIKIVESEKAVHLTYFFNGKSKKKFPNEERIIISSDKIASLDENPEMKIDIVRKKIIEKLNDETKDFILANFANVDVIGHIENENAIKKAIEAVDKATVKVVKDAIRLGVTVIVTADHGTVESWLYDDGSIDTGHTKSPVPFIIIEPNKKIQEKIKLRNGKLTDVAPTILDIFNIKKPREMTGNSLFITNPYFLHKRRVLLLILDGWGINDDKYGNLIYSSNTKNIDYFLSNYPSARLEACGAVVGMPEGTVGNSEAGHLHIGAGRTIFSDRLKIDMAIENKSFFENSTFLWAMRNAKLENKALHLLGIISFYSSHGSINHLKALMKLAKKEKINEIYIHALLGRRGERKESGAIYINEIEKECLKLNLGKVVSVIGRHWALDREENWSRVEKTYKALVYGEGRKVKSNST